MTSADQNDLVTTQEKLEWVTPQISLMGARNTDGSGKASRFVLENTNKGDPTSPGPS